jgi:hypothetical protein
MRVSVNRHCNDSSTARSTGQELYVELLVQLGVVSEQAERTQRRACASGASPTSGGPALAMMISSPLAAMLTGW